MRNISFIIPAYNEEASIRQAIDEVLKYADEYCDTCEVIVVDDGSSDGTAVYARAYVDPRVQLIQHATNKGKGAAVKTGVHAATGDWIVFLDADLSTHPSDIQSFKPYAGTHDIMIGSRALPESNLTKRQPARRELQGRLFNQIIRKLLDIPFYDTQCGFKAFHKKTKHIFAAIQTDGWIFDVELLKFAQKNGYLIKEVPITWQDDPDSRVRVSHAIQILKDLHSIKRSI